MTFHFSNHVELLFTGLITHTAGGQNFLFSLHFTDLTSAVHSTSQRLEKKKTTRKKSKSLIRIQWVHFKEDIKSCFYLELFPAATGEKVGWHRGRVGSLLPGHFIPTQSLRSIHSSLWMKDGNQRQESKPRLPHCDVTTTVSPRVPQSNFVPHWNVFAALFQLEDRSWSLKAGKWKLRLQLPSTIQPRPTINCQRNEVMNKTSAQDYVVLIELYSFQAASRHSSALPLLLVRDGGGLHRCLPASRPVRGPEDWPRVAAAPQPSQRALQLHACAGAWWDGADRDTQDCRVGV